MNAPTHHRWAGWIGRSQSEDDVLTAGQASALRATLDREPSDLSTPLGIHWLCATPRVRRAKLGQDGHPALGDFLPPVDLPRRMWASSEMEFLAPMTVGARIRRASTIKTISEKAGSTGALVFVHVEHLFSADGDACVREIQTIVYRDAPSGPLLLSEGSPALADWPWVARWPTDSVLLFRYSALTFNSHRIHYDLPYATAIEGYPGLVVQGPLMATLMLDLCERELGPNALTRFSFRGLGPAFCGETLIVAARPQGENITLQVLTDGGRTVMSGQAMARHDGA